MDSRVKPEKPQVGGHAQVVFRMKTGISRSASDRVSHLAITRLLITKFPFTSTDRGLVEWEGGIILVMNGVNHVKVDLYTFVDSRI